MTANAEIILEERKGVLMIPESAILYDEKRNTFAEVPQPGSDKGKAKVAIKTGISNGVKTQILSGLAQGQKLLLQ
jgi:HlyD family secretion protein